MGFDRAATANADLELCLSGGGFRAAAFHLGAVRRMCELGLWEEVLRVRSVSGGSILAAFLARTEYDRQTPISALDFEMDVAVPFRKFLCQDLRTVPYLLTAGFNWWWKEPRLALLERRLTKGLMGDVKLRDLDSRWHFLASDLVSGGLADFSSGSALPTSFLKAHDSVVSAMAETGQPWYTHLHSANEWPLARVVVASAAFPPIFGPRIVRGWSQLPLQEEGLNATQTRRVRKHARIRLDMALSDGGVVGNLALAGIAPDAKVLVSDASAPSNYLHVRGIPKPWSLRALTVAMSQADLQAIERLLADGSDSSAVWGIQNFGADDGFAAVAAQVRTDLDSFTADEVELLENHGYIQAARALTGFRCSRPESLAPMPPHPGWVNNDKWRRALVGSEHRVLKLRQARRAMSALAEWTSRHEYVDLIVRLVAFYVSIVAGVAGIVLGIRMVTALLEQLFQLLLSVVVLAVGVLLTVQAPRIIGR